MIGDKCFVTHVRPGTDAAKKLHPGDQILGYDGYKVERSTFEAMHYNLALLATAQSSALYLQAPDGSLRNEIVQHKIIKTARLRDYTDDQEMNYWNDIRKDEQEEKLMEPKLAEVGDVIVWRQPEFDLTDTKIDSIIAHHVAGHKALVLDLRGNPGGWRDTLKYMIGPLIDHDVTVATLEARKPEKPLIAKTVKGHVYGGQVFVLVDSESASAAELFARVIQLEHRGKVLGDRTAGAVMLAREYDEALGVDTVTPYGFSITFANLLMADGKSLEHVGVVPDERVLPTASDMAADRDPVLAQAITEAGTPITPEAAAKLIPYKWAQIDED
jgi:carboxyl-terminal processing protease